VGREIEGSILLIKVRVHASSIRFGDRLIGDAGEAAQIVVQVSSRGGEVRLSHGAAETRLIGDPLVWVLRGEPRVVEEELPHTVWRPSGPRRTQPWEGAE
jgi:hypothetical protein